VELPPPDPVGDHLRAVARGDGDAFAALVGDLRAPVYRYARSLVRSDEAAEDVLQETFVAVWRGAASYAGVSSGKVWVLGVARHLAARTWRRRVGEPDDTVPLEQLGAEAGWGLDPEALASAHEDAARVHRALDQLTESERELITLRDLEGLSGPEVAALLELPLATMKTRLHRARLRLMAALRADGDTDVV
jgi:RNA polymerase sigma-70 factor (ECF subfamily)